MCYEYQGFKARAEDDDRARKQAREANKEREQPGEPRQPTKEQERMPAAQPLEEAEVD
jgi:hypothetical protein